MINQNKQDYLNLSREFLFTCEQTGPDEFIVMSLEFPTVKATGKSRDEAVDNLKEAIYDSGLCPLAQKFFS